MLLSEILPRAAKEYPGKTAVVCGSTRLTYEEVAGRVGRLIGVFAECGLGAGDRVALLHRNCHRVFEAYYASAHAGPVLVPLNYRLTAHDLAYILDDTESRLLIADTAWTDLVEAAVKQANHPICIVWSRVEPFDPVKPGDYEALLSSAPQRSLNDASRDENDAANIYYTSGTTGHQKGVVLTHRNIYSHALSTIAELKLVDSDVWAHIAPMFHLADAWATWALTWVGARH